MSTLIHHSEDVCIVRKEEKEECNTYDKKAVQKLIRKQNS